MVFPDKGVRFIAINDNVDSDNHNQGDDILIPVKNLINESYCSELSKKLRAQFRLQRRNGEFLGAFASYGYCKSVEDKHKLVIDDYAAEIVRSIFSFKMQGYSQQATLDELDAWSAVIRNYQRVPVIDRRLVDMLVKKILVFHDKSIHSNPTSSRDVPQQRELREQQCKLEKNQEAIMQYYEEYVSGKLSKEQFLELKAKRRSAEEAAKLQVSLLSIQLEQTKAEAILAESMIQDIEPLGKYTQVERLTPELMRELVQRIVIYPGGVIHIDWNFSDTMKTSENMAVL